MYSLTISFIVANCVLAVFNKDNDDDDDDDDVSQLKSRLIEEWEHFHQVVIDKAVRQWRPRLGACVRLRAHGGH